MKNPVYWLLLTLICFQLNLQKGISQAHPGDSAALVEFYYQTNGPNWICDSNWLTTSVKNWFGVYLDSNDYRVRALELINNDLTGTIPQVLCNLEMLQVIHFENNLLSGSLPNCLGYLSLNNINVSFNNLTGLLPLSLGIPNSLQKGMLNLRNNHFQGEFPDTILKSGRFRGIFPLFNNFNKINWFQHTGEILTVRLEENKFTFDDIIPFIINPPFYPLTYSPQDSVLELIDTLIAPGSSLTLNSWVDTCSANVYSWKKNTTWLNWQSPDSTWEITNAQPSNSGYYTCQINNPDCWGLTLYRRMIHVEVGTTPGINENQDKEYTFQYNPENKMLYLLLEFSSPKSVKTSLYDVSGKKIMHLYEGTMLQQEFYHNLNRIPPGIYLFYMNIDQRVITRKILIR